VAAASFAAGFAASHFSGGVTRKPAPAPPPPPAAAAAAASPPLPAPAAPAPTPAPTPAPPAALRRATAADIDAAEEAELEALCDSALVPDGVELKLVCCVRSDLKMSPGKIAAQVGHAVLGAVNLSRRVNPEFVKAWEFRAQAKITLKVDDEATMDAIVAAARAAGLPAVVIEDAGRTEVEPGTRTVLSIGPAPRGDIDAITGPKGRFPLGLLR
jgi:peptidyl-tRNA hydrolase